MLSLYSFALKHSSNEDIQSYLLYMYPTLISGNLLPNEYIHRELIIEENYLSIDAV